MKTIINILLTLILVTSAAFARDIEVDSNSSEIRVYVSAGEPTQINLPGYIEAGYKGSTTGISVQKNGSNLIILSNSSLSEEKGESMIVRLKDGRSYSLRIMPTSEGAPRDDFVSIIDSRAGILPSEDEEDPAYKEKNLEYAPATAVSGFMREMMLAMEFGKANIPGYRRSDQYKGQVVLNDGAILSTINTIFIGPGMWGYVLDTTNMLDISQKINPASFRLDGTRAISMNNWELSPKPLTNEQQIANKHNSLVYIITRAKR